MAGRNYPPHWIAANHASRIPRRFITVDSEAIVTPTRNGEVHTFRCAVACRDGLSERADGWMPPKWSEHDAAGSLWEWIDANTVHNGRTVVVAHNAGYDLRVTDGLRHLDRLGWTLKMLSLGTGATWGQWKKGKRTLVLVDSLTWIPLPLESIGKLIGQDKLPLPDQSHDDATWMHRCRTDVEILRDAWLRIIRWLRDNDAGNWRPTGAGTGSSWWRHKHFTHRVVVHNDDERKALERRAAWTGRAEAWKIGRLPIEPWTEYDWSMAYCRIAARHALPVAMMGSMQLRPGFSLEKPRPGRAFLCDVEVTQELPVLPVEKDGGIVWPVGTFTTTAWDNEIRCAMQHGATVRVLTARPYACTPALASWAQWCLDTVNAPYKDVDPVVRSMVKHWSRAVIGRFGSRYTEWEHTAQHPDSDVSLGWTWHDGDELAKRTLQVGHRVMEQGKLVYTSDAVPSIMSWIMAQSRVNLWTAMVAAGLDNVAYVDTDSLIVNHRGAAKLHESAFDGLRVKAQYPRLEVMGTRKLVQNGALRASGVPRDAERVGGSVWAADAWEGLVSSLAAGRPDRVTVNRRRIDLRGVEKRRRRTPGGTTEAWRL